MINKASEQNIFFVDTYSQKSSHEIFNASLILMCSMIFKKVDLRISESSYENYLKIIDRQSPDNIIYKNVLVVVGSSRFSLIMRYLLSAIQNIKYLIITPKDVILIFPYNNLFSLRILNFLNKILKKKILIFCHGEMEGIVTDTRKGGFLHRILTKLSHNFFLNKNIKISEGLFFSVLGDVLKQNISEIIDANKAGKFISIDHAYFFEDVETVKKTNSIFNIATVGTINKTKGLLGLLEFSKKIKPLVREQINISVIGTTNENISLFQGTKIELSSKNNVLLSRDEFNEKINELDYILFFYPNDSYSITASGAIMDAIRFEKPILALKNVYFEYIFNKYGSFGYLCENIEDMVLKIEELSKRQVINDIDFDSIKTKVTPEILSLQLLEELNRINFVN
ncbi:Glycosyltransferase involved in cell wall bisynthesis [Flavobacterium segetis]|uniref:Glycosyltransferase involved in cell wall bisynthesis n=1 Tax=Flavobacterium segetis TaxID=271157 RepID=A0A1M5IH07_9FLAO|nr:glycosyltransferase [Flavobacterium segetis]SHG27073.1 Glycosyltransferase involved in cell wall bisynthesis [Flavobacterium segetis]